ncbi:MAG: type II toxin-antitoxin system VapC family toxin [Cyanobacteria bacterium J06555_13]
MIILDTNVLSELMKFQCSEAVEGWIKAQSRRHLFTTAITKAEVLYGVAILPQGARKRRLYEIAMALFQEELSGKVLSFDPISAEHFATISANRRTKGLSVSQSDAQIAAICLAHQATIATRNVKDFTDCQLNIINPWEA